MLVAAANVVQLFNSPVLVKLSLNCHYQNNYYKIINLNCEIGSRTKCKVVYDRPTVESGLLHCHDMRFEASG